MPLDHVPIQTITTHYPVWRARDLPFGAGILSLPQRGETTLEMWSNDDPAGPTDIFKGHTDMVKEFVWRRGGLGQCSNSRTCHEIDITYYADRNEFQLITWSTDRTLRFWPIDTDMMKVNQTILTLNNR